MLPWYLLCSYNVGCTKRMGLFPNRRTPLDHMRNQRTLKDGGLEGHKEVRQSEIIHINIIYKYYI